jgi:hypothetical protein
LQNIVKYLSLNSNPPIIANIIKVILKNFKAILLLILIMVRCNGARITFLINSGKIVGIRIKKFKNPINGGKKLIIGNSPSLRKGWQALALKKVVWGSCLS